MVVVGQDVSAGVRQTASYLCTKGLRVTCVEFAFFQDGSGTSLMSQEIVVGKESEQPTRVTSSSLPIISQEEFLASLDSNGRAVFSEILELAKKESMPIHWGTRGFSVNVDVDGTHAAICYAYPPESVFKQTLRTAFRDIGGMEKKTAVPPHAIASLREQAIATGLFAPAGSELKCHVTRQLTQAEIGSLLGWCEAAAQAVRKHGLKE